MEVTITTSSDISVKELAKVLANASPEEFADFWMEFSILYNDKKLSEDKIREFGKALSPSFGCLRKQALKDIVRYMDYYSIEEELKLLNEKEAYRRLY